MDIKQFILTNFSKLKKKPNEIAWFEKIGFVPDIHVGKWNYAFIDGFDHTVYFVILTQIIYTINSTLGLLSIPVGMIALILQEMAQARLYSNHDAVTPNNWKHTWYTNRHDIQDWILPTIVGGLLIAIRHLV